MTTSHIRIDVYHHFNIETEQLSRIETAVQTILERQLPMSDFQKLQTSLDALRDNVNNIVIPLLQKIAAGGADQTTIDALAKEAQDVLDALSGAETATPAPTPAP